MASLTSGDNIDWLWGSLKPWQILHSTLAERERCGSVLDVWELVNETLSASTTRCRGQEGDGGSSHGMHFLGDLIDRDFWRPGGVMETRVKECLNARIKGDDEEEGALALQLSAAHHHHHHHHHHLMHKCSTELAIASSAQELPCARRSISWQSAATANAHDLNHCKVEEESDEEHEEDHDQGLLDEAAAAAEEEEEESGIHGYTDEDLELEGEGEEEEEDEDSASAPYTQTTREANYSLIRSYYQDNPNYREISRDSASVLVLNPCCSAVAAAAGDDPAAAVWGETAEFAERLAVPPDLEENIEVCAVCLEKLTHYYEEGVQALACRHAFHTVCIAPWLQRQPHACCPCCRAPIFPDNLAPPLHLPAPLDLAADHRLHDRYACDEDQQPAQGASNDIMGLLADMEAALEHLGFRS